MEMVIPGMRKTKWNENNKMDLLKDLSENEMNGTNMTGVDGSVLCP
jgi:hypothetical protein